MSTRAEILASNRGREPKSPAIYRRGRVNNSAAYYRAAKPQMDKAGRQAKALADFIGAVAKPIGQAVKAEQDEFIEAERNAGIASFTRATPEQRAKMRRAIKNGIISESESPYFREGVSIAYTKNLLSRYNQDLFQRYEAWREKNDPNSGTFDAFLDNFDAEYAPHFETIHEEILVEHFVPGQMGIRRQLQQRHTEHLNKNYREDAEAQLQNTMFDAVNDRANDATVEAVTNGVSYGKAVTTGRKNDGLELDELIVYRQAVEQGLTAEQFDKKEKKKKPTQDATKVSPLTTWNSVSKAYSMPKKHVVDLARQIKVLEYKGKPQPEGKQDLSYIEPKNWTPEQRKEFESLIDDIKGMTAEGKVILKNK